MSSNYRIIKMGPKGKLIVIDILGFRTEIHQNPDGTLEGAVFEGQALSGFITGVRATLHSVMVRQGMYEDYVDRIRRCFEVIAFIDKLVEEHNSAAATKLEVTKTF